jgi:CheY-like chemotaxis protein/AraC-like DNA-binding protein
VRGASKSPAPRPQPTSAAKPAAVARQAYERPVVLVVDDDDGVREALHLILDDDYVVLDVGDGRTAISIIRAQPVDLVLLDILMPEVDGIEILQELRTFAPTLPVIMMTAVKTVLTAVSAMKLGAHDYITKPFQDASLLASIRTALEARAGPRTMAGDGGEPGSASRSARANRILVVEGDLGWRAALAVTLGIVASVETASSLDEALNRLLKARPTCVILKPRRSSAEAARFLGAVHAQLPGCPALVISDDPHLQAALAWEPLNIRGVLRPPVAHAEVVDRMMAIALPGRDTNRSWPRLSLSVSAAIDHLGAHFGEDLNVATLAGVAGISASHLAHLFRAETGLTVRDYVTRVRVEITRDLLQHTDDTLAQIAAFVGFFDASHLARVFRQLQGQRPNACRRLARA